MKKLLSILVLGLLLSVNSYADDDIRDLQLNGMSLGDSALEYFDEKEIKKNIKNWYKNKDGYETPKTLSFLNLNTVVYKDISKSTCKPKLIFGKHHGIPLTKCFAEKQSNANDVINFLEKTF